MDGRKPSILLLESTNESFSCSLSISLLLQYMLKDSSLYFNSET